MAALELARRQGNDDGTVEAKTCSGDLSKDVCESVSASANTRDAYRT